MPNQPLAEIEKYRVIIPKTMASSNTAGLVGAAALGLSFGLWIFYCIGINYHPTEQWMAIIVAVVGVCFQKISSMGARSHLELKAKGLDIRDPAMTALMPWNRLEKVELRMRSFNFFPNYVDFKFINGSDVLILWDDVKDTMDSTTLISCVKTWAPQAKIVGDAKLAKSESIATYTEMWLKDMSGAKLEKRQRENQALIAGTCLKDSYVIERVLSGGGQGTAYLAKVLPLADLPDVPPQIVIKEYILPSNERGLKKATDGLEKEAAIMRRISHPHIVKLYDHFVEDMRGYFALEFIDGASLRQMIELNGPMPERRAAAVIIEMCKVLTYLHNLNPPVIHGDVTPDNIMMEKSGDIKLMDFDASVELTRNKTNTVVGKHSYMSPEQFKGDLTNSSDVYALGCTLFFLLTGHDPEPMSESDPSRYVQNTSEWVNDIVRQATKFDLSQRITDLQHMSHQLEQL